MTNIAHNFGKPLGWAVVADCPEHPKLDGMLCGGAHTFKDDAHKAARDPTMGSVRVVPLGPWMGAELTDDELLALVTHWTQRAAIHAGRAANADEFRGDDFKRQAAEDRKLAAKARERMNYWAALLAARQP